MDATGHVTLIYHGTKVSFEPNHDASSIVSFQYDLRVLPEHAAKYMSIMPEKKQIDLASVLISPMPGIVKSVSVQVGQRVVDGQEVCVVEAMKMQNKLTAGRAGVVSGVLSVHSWWCDVHSSRLGQDSDNQRRRNCGRWQDFDWTRIVTMPMNSYLFECFFNLVVLRITILVEYVDECIFDLSFANMRRKPNEIVDTQRSCLVQRHWDGW